jgi:hypothetical protein
LDISSEEDLSAEKTSSSQLPNYVSIFTTANSYNLRSKSSQKDEITEILEGTSTEATSTPKQSKYKYFHYVTFLLINKEFVLIKDARLL